MKAQVVEVNCYSFKDPKTSVDVAVRKVTFLDSENRLLTMTFDKNIPEEKMKAMLRKETLVVVEVTPDFKGNPRVRVVGVSAVGKE